MCDRYWVLDNIWLLPVIISVVAGVFTIALKAVTNVRCAAKDYSARAQTAGMSKKSANT
jgi:hypothetical protein